MRIVCVRVCMAVLKHLETLDEIDFIWILIHFE